MKKYNSLNFRLVLFLGILLVSILGIGVLINKLFFYGYYLSNEKDDIYSFAQELDHHYKIDFNSEEHIETFLMRKKASLLIFTSDDLKDPIYYYQSIYDDKVKGNRKHNLGAPYISDSLLDETASIGHKFFFIDHPKYGSEMLTLAYLLHNGDLLLITSPLEAITESANIAIRFNVIIAVLSLLIGLVVAYFLATRISKPIVRLAGIAKKIASLDFSEKYIPTTNDEIRVLGSNINNMSDVLEASLKELKNANSKLLIDIEEKEKIVEMRKEFIARISHELKTPIALIMGYTEGLQENLATNQEKKDHYLDVISQESNHMNVLVKDLLSLTELEYDAFTLNMTDIDISSLMDEVLDRYSILIKEKRIKVSIEKNDIIIITGDKKRLEQAYSNIILNALEYTPVAGFINIRVIELEKYHRITVENSGSHIDENDLKNIWNNFYKSKDTTRKIGGSGLGLSIVRAVIEKHNGNYGVECKDFSVEFYIELRKKLT